MGRHQQAPRKPLLKPDEGLFENIYGKLRCPPPQGLAMAEGSNSGGRGREVAIHRL